MTNIRQGAFTILRDVEEKKAYSNIAISNYILKFKPTNAPFLREIVYGTVRYNMYLDFIIGNFVKTPMEKMQISDKIILRMGLYQLIFMNSVPDYAAVDESVELAKRFSRGHDSFINGVLRQFLRDREYIVLPDREKDEIEYLSVKYSINKWIVEMWVEELGVEETEALMDALNKTPELCIRPNSLRLSANDLTERFRERGFEVAVDDDLPELLYVKGEGVITGSLFTSGMFSVQDKGSQSVVKMMAAKPGDTVIDVCSAPGGKATAMAEGMRNTGKVIATDIYKRKVDTIEDDAKRLGIKILDARCWDATKTDSSLIEVADRVLVDAPCSGLGTARRKPEVKYKEFDENMKRLPEKQLDILNVSSQYVKPGGILVYSTCTVAKNENEGVVKAFLRRQKEFDVIERVQLLPHIDGTDGFFICKMKKSDSLIKGR